MKLEYWFPTVTGMHEVPDQIQQITADKIQQWIDQGDVTTYVEASTHENLNTSYHKHHDVLGHIGLCELHTEILTCACAYAQGLGLHIQPEQIRVDSWINFFEPGQSEHQHNHYGNFLSGTYYVQAAPDSGAYAFFDPAPQKVMWQGLYLTGAQPQFTNQNTGTHVPAPGKLILFPSWLEHAVWVNRSNQTRISIAFNINPYSGIRS